MHYVYMSYIPCGRPGDGPKRPGKQEPNGAKHYIYHNKDSYKWAHYQCYMKYTRTINYNKI